MTISFWRYSHLVLAISSFLFLLVAAFSGIILAFEPISNKMQPFSVANASELTIAKTIDNIKSQYIEVISITKDKNDFVSAFVITENGSAVFYVNPFTGKKLGDPIEKSKLFHFATNLHRSLFLKSTGRFFIGLVSFLLFLISISGIFLIIRRQGNIKEFFSKIVKENFSQYYHITLGRLSLIPIVILALTGTYLSLLRFDIIPDDNLVLNVDYDAIKDFPKINSTDFQVFQENTLANFRELEFPFSDDIEDYYHLKLTKKEIIINQYTGTILSQQEYPFIALASRLSFNLHTGTGSIIWSIIIGLATCAIPFFIYSGFAMTLKRRKSKIKNKFKKDNAEYIILVGSESGTTLQFANLLHNELLNIEKRSFITELNNFTTFKKMKHLVVIAATYGQGEPPTNATKFLQKFKDTKIPKNFSFSVVGFGSFSYPDFCKFAYDVDALLISNTNSKKLLDVHTVNNQSFESFSQWINDWSKQVDLTIDLPKKSIVLKRKKTTEFITINKTDTTTNPDDTFLLELKTSSTKKYQSGDLLAIYPENDTRERLYSIAVQSNNTILLSVKRHENGICSNYLNNVAITSTIEGYLIKNSQFHFPKKRIKVIMICTGTGIAPFLGMIQQNIKKQEIHLYWGAKNSDSFDLYDGIISEGLKQNRLTKFISAYSRAQKEKIYVQHLIKRDANFIADVLKQNGVIMICGSINMQKEVLHTLTEICSEKTRENLSYYQNKKRIKMDCY